MIHIFHDFPVRHSSRFSTRFDDIWPKHLEQIFGACANADADREDWLEAVYRATSILDACEANNVALWTVDANDRLIPANDHARACAEANIDVLYDFSTFPPRSAARMRLPLCTVFPKNLNYGLNAGFIAHAGRDFVMCNNDPDKDEPGFEGDRRLNHISEVIKQFAGREILWKQMTGPPKSYPLETIDLTHLKPGQNASSRMSDDTQMAMVHLGGMSALQAKVKMICEYRMFVIDGKVVTGAGCVESMTPNERSLHDFDDMMEEQRNRSQMNARPLLRDRMVNAAQMFVADILNAPESEAYAPGFVMDLYLGEDNAIHIVEINPVMRSGLYASNPKLIFDAAVRYVVENAPGLKHRYDTGQREWHQKVQACSKVPEGAPVEEIESDEVIKDLPEFPRLSLADFDF